MFKRLRFKTAAGAGGIGIGGPPDRVGGQVTFAGSHLLDPAYDEFAQTHEGSWVQGGEMVVIPWCREEMGPLCEEGLPNPFLQGGLGVIHQGQRRDCRGQRDAVGIHHGHPRQPVGKGNGLVSHRLYRQVVPRRGTGRVSSTGGGGTQKGDRSSGPLSSHALGGQKERGRMRGGVLSLGECPVGSKQHEALPVFVVRRSGVRPGSGGVKSRSEPVPGNLSESRGRNRSPLI